MKFNKKNSSVYKQLIIKENREHKNVKIIQN